MSAAAAAMAAALRRCRRLTGVAVLEVGRCGVVSWVVMVETVLPAACGTLARGSQALAARLGGVGSARTAMDFRILGPLEVRADGRTVALTGASQRAVLAVLALHANEPVSGERLALALWGEDAGARSVKTVQVHVSRLRKALGDPGVLVTTTAGYRLGVGADELDV